MNSKIIDLILGIIATSAVTFAGFACHWSYTVSTDLLLLQQDNVSLKSQLDEMKINAAQNQQIKFLWIYTKWLQNGMTTLYFRDRIQPPPLPDFPSK